MRFKKNWVYKAREKWIGSAAILCCLCLWAPVAGAWTEATYRMIAADAMQLMPSNLQWVMNKYSDAFMRGIYQAQAKSSSNDQFVTTVISETKNGIQNIKKNRSYENGVANMGRILRLIGSNIHPFQPVELLKNEQWRTDYDIFLEKHRSHFRIRWKGSDKRPSSEQDLARLLQESMKRLDKISDVLVTTLEKENRPIGSYDVRSIPFGVGSISYSNAVSNIAYSWLYIWDQVGGI